MRYLVSNCFILLFAGFYSAFLSAATDSTAMSPLFTGTPTRSTGYILDQGVVTDNHPYTDVIVYNKKCAGGTLPYLHLSVMRTEKPGGDYGLAELHLSIEKTKPNARGYTWEVRHEFLGAMPGRHWFYLHFTWMVLCI